MIPETEEEVPNEGTSRILSQGLYSIPWLTPLPRWILVFKYGGYNL